MLRPLPTSPGRFSSPFPLPEGVKRLLRLHSTLGVTHNLINVRVHTYILQTTMISNNKITTVWFPHRAPICTGFWLGLFKGTVQRDQVGFNGHNFPSPFSLTSVIRGIIADTNSSRNHTAAANVYRISSTSTIIVMARWRQPYRKFIRRMWQPNGEKPINVPVKRRGFYNFRPMEEERNPRQIRPEVVVIVSFENSRYLPDNLTHW